MNTCVSSTHCDKVWEGDVKVAWENHAVKTNTMLRSVALSIVSIVFAVAVRQSALLQTLLILSHARFMVLFEFICPDLDAGMPSNFVREIARLECGVYDELSKGRPRLSVTPE